MKFSHTSMSLWRRCRYAYFLKYVGNYLPSGSKGQIRGKAGHAGLAEWYRTGDGSRALDIAYKELMFGGEQSGLDMQDEWPVLDIVLNRYFVWSTQNDNFIILTQPDAEGKEVPTIEFTFNFSIGPYVFTGIIDGLVEYLDAYWVLEHKFEKQAHTKNLELNAQISMYLLAVSALDIPVRGVLYNIVRVAEGGIAAKEPVVRLPTYRNPEGLSVVARELEGQAEEMTRFLEKGGRVYRNATKDCSWDCGFYNVCLSVNDNGDADSILRKLKRYNPDKEELYGDQEVQ